MITTGSKTQHKHASQFSPLRLISSSSICRIVCCSIISVCCISLVGCGPRLAESRDVDLVGGEIKSIILDAVASEQTINIDASAEQPFNLHVYLLEDESALDAELARGAEPTKALAGASDSKAHKFSATAPGGKEVGIRLESSGGQDFTVKLKISN